MNKSQKTDGHGRVWYQKSTIIQEILTESENKDKGEQFGCKKGN